MEIENVRYCGELQTPFTVITSTDFVTLRFISDNIVTRTGFLAVWTPTTEPPTTKTKLVSCGQHFATDCSQCPYNGKTWVGEGWCNGDCHWIDEECTRTDLLFFATTSPTITLIAMTTTLSSSSSFEQILENTKNKKATAENVIKSPNFPLSYPVYSDQVSNCQTIN